MVTKRYSSEDAAVDSLYADVAESDLQPLWEMKGLLTPRPVAKAVPFRWRLADLMDLGRRASDLIPIDRGGDRRVLAFANPGLNGAPYVSNTLWAAAQFLGPGEHAPAHRHSPAALRFVLEGEGVWTLVNDDPVHMSRGDVILTPSWNFHEHHNPGDKPMVWLDVLDLPVVEFLEAIFFEEGPSEAVDRRTDPRSASERYFGQGAGIVPVGRIRAEITGRHSPLLVFRWADADFALTAMLEVEDSGDAQIRYQDPVSGNDVMPTLRCEMRRVVQGTTTGLDRQTGSRVCAVLSGTGQVKVADEVFDLQPGDVFVVPSWKSQQVTADTTLDIFTTSDAPVLEALKIYREEKNLTWQH